ncbi:MAG TPA: DUF4097 family beta strand repeat-containing protein [Clostridiales bacterium]|mgnify:CR=1 FL=1|nr:DUF4097 family beta strand repeat-containing protein [Clostridiales bacterium]HPV02011.1 DUF4097 family beta strand repeat-containing protein [Clostridiales bacterium]
MSISEEKMMILKMLQEGRINSEEAAKLLEALESKKEPCHGPGGFRGPKPPQRNYYDEVAKVRERIDEWRRQLSKNYNQSDFDKMVEEFSAKAEKFGKNVATAAFGIADKVADFIGSIIDTSAFNIFGNCVTEEEQYEVAAAEGMNLELQATNGQITVKKHQEDKIVIKAKIRTPQENAKNALAFSNENGTVAVKLAKPDTYNLSVSYDVLLPAVKFNQVALESKNGKIYVEDVTSEEFVSATKNAVIDLTGINSSRIAAETMNAKVTANYIIGRDVSFGTKNASIEIKNLKAVRLTAVTMNGNIMLDNVQNYDNENIAELNLKTMNANIKANMNDSENRGYKINARTMNSDINLLIPNLLYRNAMRINRSHRQADAETDNYATADKKVNIQAETMNGYIEIIK